MAATPSSNPNPSGAPRDPSAENPIPPSFEDNLHEFWKKNSKVVIALAVLVLAFFVGKGVWERVQENKERDIEQAKQAANTPEKLKSFISAHPGHPLAGVAEIELADQAYTEGKAADAIAAYDRAVSILKTGPLAGRARLGRAVAKVQAGQSANAVTELAQIANDANELKVVRTEAAYDLASLASEAGNSADVQKYVDLINQVDPQSPWARRAMILQAAAPAAPKADQPAGVQLKVPAK